MRRLNVCLVVLAIVSADVVAQETNPESGINTESRESGRSAGRGRGFGAQRGRGPGARRGAGRGPDAAMRADQEVFHFLLEHHQAINRQVKNLPNGVETLTESDDIRVAAKIQEHVAAMHERVQTGRGL